MGPSANGGGISIPTGDAPMSGVSGDEQGWAAPGEDAEPYYEHVNVSFIPNSMTGV